MTSGTEARPDLRGAMTALVTPFRGGAIDWTALDALIDRQIAGGINWLVPCGTTGESPTISTKERDSLLDRVLTRSNGRCPVLAGTGSNSTTEAIERTKRARASGANAAMLVAPYYNRPTPEGLFRHYAAIADAVDLPIVLYDVPKRTGVTIPIDVIVRLRESFPNVVAIKDATGDVDRVSELISRCDITVLSGDDSLTLPLMVVGAKGLVSVLSNLAPLLVVTLVRAALSGDWAVAQGHHRSLFDLATGLGGCGPNPLPIKTALAIRGEIAEEFRLPLCPLDEDRRHDIEAVLRRHELLRPGGP